METSISMDLYVAKLKNYPMTNLENKLEDLEMEYRKAKWEVDRDKIQEKIAAVENEIMSRKKPRMTKRK